ncbi:MAG: type 1 glutamine amidotransferase [Tyzzerella sp.]|nr:type 1 glutamine amidotransferase [Tyzzerella sp.]
MKTKIGIVICGLENNRQFVTDAYIQAVKSAGGLPIIIPLIKSKSVIAEYVELCDGFLFCGGGDITPLLFGQEPVSGIGKTDITLDLFQIRLMKHVLEAEKPVLAICRGMQVLNVACGGTIYQDLNEADFETINHMQTSLSRKDISHKVTFTAKTHIQRMLGPFAYTNSFHHQAIERVGKDLIVTGTTGDDIVEAIEMPSHSFVLGVQWHPESMLDSAPNMKQLFFALVRYAKVN